MIEQASKVAEELKKAVSSEESELGVLASTYAQQVDTFKSVEQARCVPLFSYLFCFVESEAKGAPDSVTTHPTHRSFQMEQQAREEAEEHRVRDRETLSQRIEQLERDLEHAREQERSLSNLLEVCLSVFFFLSLLRLLPPLFLSWPVATI